LQPLEEELSLVSMIRLLLALTVSIIMIVANKAIAQPFSNYINYSSVWGMKSGYINSVNRYVSYFQYYIKGDTTIGSYSYFKLYRTGVDSVIPLVSGGTPTATSVNYFEGALREDSQKKFYFIYKGQSIEYVLFDFNLYEGSFLEENQSNYYCNDPQLMVNSYTTVYLGTTPLKRFEMDNANMQPIIEGVGSGGGLIEKGSMCLFFESYSKLICYKKDLDILNVNSSIPCSITLGVEDEHAVGGFSVFPNPFSSQTVLKTGKPFQNATFTVSNSLGQTVKQMENLSGQTITFNREDLPSGIYFVRLSQNQNAFFADKLVITDN
jgi:hypothetical protein